MCKNNIYKTIFLCFIVLFFFSCDPGTGIYIKNNTDNQIIIECDSIYNKQVYKTEMIYGKLTGFVEKDNGGYFTILIGSYELNKLNSFNILGCVGFDIISELKYGTIKSIDDVVSAIDIIFKEINVYIFDNDGKKILLYNKNYFLDKENIVIESPASFSGGIVRIIINDLNSKE
jgi:hypothetical protein